MSEVKTKKEPKQYLTGISRKYVYGGLAVFAFIALFLFLFVPHYKPLNYADAQESTDANRAIIQQYFLNATNCKNDNRDKPDRIKTFNKYFLTNEFANRAVFRGCNDKDVFLAEDDAGKWQKVDTALNLDTGQSEKVRKACLTEEIIKESTVLVGNGAKGYMPQQIQEERVIKTCDKLAKESYIEVNLKQGIDFNF